MKIHLHNGVVLEEIGVNYQSCSCKSKKGRDIEDIIIFSEKRKKFIDFTEEMRTRTEVKTYYRIL